MRTASEAGFDIAFLTSDVGRYLADPAAAEVLSTHVGTVVSCATHDVDAVVAAVRALPRPARGVLTFTDYHTDIVAAAAARLGLPHLDPAAARTARNKLATRTRCAERGVPGPAFRFVDSVGDIDAALLAVGLPCVVKPVDESGSIGTTLCRTKEEVAVRIAELGAGAHNSRGQPRVPGGLVEEFVSGPEVSVETFTRDGRTTVLGVTDKLLGPAPHFIELGQTFPSRLLRRQQRAAGRLALAALDAVGFDFGPAHTEVKLTANGPVLIEINARAGGDLIPELIRHATGIDLIRQVITAFAGGRPELAPTARRGAAIRFRTARAGIVAEVPDVDALRHSPGVVAARLTARPGQSVADAHSSHDRIGFVLAAGSSSAQAARYADTALARLDVRYQDERVA